MDELHLRDPGHSPTIAKESGLCSTELEQSRIEETHATQFEIPTNPVYCSKEVILAEEEKWNDILDFKGDSLQAEILKIRHEIGTSL